ncbi:MAG: VWA domain-containing protein [Planctomycetota bacterium]|nr:VWA domain-containing protein [Planctomycetota bacterium]
MTVEFRCENCGKLLNIEGKPSPKIKCPYCKARILTPAALASFSGQQAPPRVDNPASRPEHPSTPPVEEEILVQERPDALTGVMATLMPWVISLFFHAGVLVILAFIMIVTSRTSLKANVVVPDVPLTEDLSESIAGEMSPELNPKSFEQADDRWAQRDSRIPSADLGRTENKIQLYGSAGGATGGGARARFGLPTGGKPKSRFFGTGGTAYHIVYVVDRSGSMLETFDEVRKEIIKSFSKLVPQQTFHVIFFASGKPKENPPQRLVYANSVNKRAALKFLKVITPEGQTDPIPALKRAFAVLNRPPGNKQGKLIYLLTDGRFPDNEKILAAVREMNAKRDVHINTILHHFRDPEFEKVLEQIAAQNGGKFKFVEPNE